MSSTRLSPNHREILSARSTLTGNQEYLTSTSGILNVSSSGGGGSGFSIIDEAAWTAGVSSFVPNGGVFNDSAAALTSGQQGTERLTPNRAVHANLRNNAGTEVGTSTTPLQVSLANTAANATPVTVSGTITAQSTSANLYVGQVTVNTSQVQVSSVSHALSNGIIIKAPSTNAVNIVVGLTGVTATTGDIIEPGESRGYAVNNTNLLYIISASSTTDTITYSAN